MDVVKNVFLPSGKKNVQMYVVVHFIYSAERLRNLNYVNNSTLSAYHVVIQYVRSVCKRHLVSSRLPQMFRLGKEEEVG